MTRIRNGAAERRPSGPSGPHKTPRLSVKLPGFESDELLEWQLSARAEGLSFGAWLVEAARMRVRTQRRAGLL